MRSYKIAFFIALTAAVILAGGTGFLWLHPSHLQNTAPANVPAQPPEANSEPKLAPVELTPQRIQAIGVKTGTVQMKQIHDEIRTVGNVEVDETRLAYAQV